MVWRGLTGSGLLRTISDSPVSIAQIMKQHNLLNRCIIFFKWLCIQLASLTIFAASHSKNLRDRLLLLLHAREFFMTKSMCALIHCRLPSMDRNILHNDERRLTILLFSRSVIMILRFFSYFFFNIQEETFAASCTTTREYSVCCSGVSANARKLDDVTHDLVLYTIQFTW